MEKLLVLSDSHFLEEEVQQVISNHRDNVDYVVHCGDSQLKNNHPALRDIDVIVLGNTDWPTQYEQQVVLELDNTRVFVTHGHLYQVTDIFQNNLAQESKQRGCALALYGHTHVPQATISNGVWCVNPGSLHASRSYTVPFATYAIVTIDGSHVVVDYYNTQHEKVSSLTREFELEMTE